MKKNKVKITEFSSRKERWPRYGHVSVRRSRKEIIAA